MNTLLRIQEQSPGVWRSDRNKGLTLLLLGLMAAALLLAACGGADLGPATATPTEEVVQSASIEGVLWHDLCANESTELTAPAGCVVDPATGRFVANGIREAGELGLPDVRIALGSGLCPSSGLAEVMTDAEGRYAIEGLWPGEYCVSVVLGGGLQPADQVPGVWTTPGNGMQTVELASGEHRADVSFGWDFLNQPALPTPTPTPSPTVTPSPRCIDAAEFIKDVTIPDGTRLDPGASFTKTWRLRNSGNCRWTSDYELVFYSGDRMSGSYVLPLSGAVEPGQSVDLSVKLVAPKTLGTYLGYWMLRNADGGLFGLGADAFTPMWVKILIDPKITEWEGEYFANRKLEGNPALIRNDEEIDFNWKSASPAAGLPADDFSARWTREMKFSAAPYRFSVRVDDGARLWVDNRLVIDEWEDGADRTVSVVLALSKGRHDIKLEFYERAGAARIHLDIGKVSVDSGGKWIVSYWFNRSLDSEWALIKTVDKVDVNWGRNAPAQGIPADHFSARWSRTVEFEPGIYRLYARADDGIRVKIDGNRVINEWHDSNASETYTAEVELSGSHDLELEYYEREAHAQIHFWWEFLGPKNQPPIARADAYETAANQVLIVPAPGVLVNDEDPDGDSLVAVLVGGALNGSVALNPDGSFVYSPSADFVGEDSFTYQISDGQAASSAASVTVSVLPGNLPPVAGDDSYEVVEDGLLAVPAPGILANDSDPEGQALQILLETEPAFGILTLSKEGAFEYAPQADFHGVDQFSYRVSDGSASSGLATVQLTVLPVNDLPQAVDDQVAGSQDQPLEIDVLANDVGLGDGPLTISIEIAPAAGSIEIVGKLVVYTPAAGFVGEDSFEYAVSDQDGERSQALVTIVVAPSIR